LKDKIPEIKSKTMKEIDSILKDLELDQKKSNLNLTTQVGTPLYLAPELEKE